MPSSKKGLRRALVSTAACLALFAAGGPASASAATTPLAQVGTPGAGAGQLATPVGLALDGAGNIYVADENNTRIAEFGPDGSFLRAFGADVAMPAGGAALETCTTATGCKAGVQGAAAGEMLVPSAVAVGPAGKLYVADSFNNRVDVFNVSAPDVTFDRAFGFDVLGPTGDNANFESCSVSCIAGDQGPDAGVLRNPKDLALDGAGKLYVAEQGNNRISVIDVSGSSPAFLRAFGKDVNPAAGSGLEDCTTGSGCQFGGPTGDGGALVAPVGLGLDSANRLYVTESTGNRVSVFDVSSSTTSFLRAFGGDVALASNTGSPFEVCPLNGPCQSGESDGGGGAFDFPTDAALDTAGNLYVTDSNNMRVDVFNVAATNPTFTRTFGRDVLDPPDGNGFEICGAADLCFQGDPGTNPGDIAFPGGVAVDCRGAIWVSEPPNNRLERFGEPGTGSCPLPPATGGGTGNQTAAPAGPTGQRAAALKKCKKKKGAARKKCKKKAKKLPV